MGRHRGASSKVAYINVLWQWHDIFLRQFRLVGDIVLQHPTVSIRGLVQTTVLDHGALQQNIQVLSIPGDCETLETLVIAASRRWVRRNRVEILVVDGWVVRRKAVYEFCQHLWNFEGGEVLYNVPLNSISHWNIRIWGPHRHIHLPRLVKFVHVWPILITNPESPIIILSVEHQSLWVHGHPHATLPCTTESISSILRCRERRESIIIQGGSGIKTRNRLSGWVAEEDSVYVEELHIWWGGGGSICRGGGEIDLEFMEARLPEGGSFSIPTIRSVSLSCCLYKHNEKKDKPSTVRHSPQRPLIVCLGSPVASSPDRSLLLRPALSLKCNCRAQAHCVTILIPKV